jgi:hypothetical protein
VYPSSENQDGLEEQSGKSFFGSEDTSYSPSLFDSDSPASGKGCFKNPTKYKNGLSGVGQGKSYFEENATDEGSGVNFINILEETFTYESAFRSFSLTTVWPFYFLSKEYCIVLAQKLLVKCL